MLWTTVYWQPAMLAALVSTAVSVFVWRRRRVPGGTILALLTSAVAWWALTNSLTLLSPDLNSKIFWFGPQYVAVCTTPPLFLMFTLSYCGLERFLKPHYLIGLFLWPATVFILAQTNPAHGLIWADITLVTSGPIPMAVIDHGSVFWLWVVYVYICLTLGTLTLIRAWFTMPAYYHRQLTVMIVGISAPWLANIIYIMDLSPLPGLDLTPLAFTISGPTLVWGLYRYRISDLAPIARSRAFDAIGDAVLVLDDDDRLVDCNRSARQLLGHSEPEVIGHPLADFLPHRSDLLENYRDVKLAHEKITLHPKGIERHYDLQISPVLNYRNKVIGRMILLRDVTERRLAEERLTISEALFRNLVEALPFPVVIFTAANQTEYVNNKFVELFGFRREEVSERKAYTAKLIPDDEMRRELERAFDSRLKEGQPPLEKEAVFFDRYNSGHEVLVHRVPLGQRVYHIIEDITRRKEAERARHLKARLEGVTEMAGTALHEMNQPLQAIYGQCEMLIIGLSPHHDLSKRAETIMNAVDRLSLINDKIKSITRYETRDYDGRTRIIDLDKASGAN